MVFSLFFDFFFLLLFLFLLPEVEPNPANAAVVDRDKKGDAPSISMEWRESLVRIAVRKRRERRRAMVVFNFDYLFRCAVWQEIVFRYRSFSGFLSNYTRYSKLDFGS
jgi:hypothetical protein